ncbi:MAG: pitrilysin family protein [Patescibacteria group bacterium]
MFKLHTLKNGLRVILTPSKESNSVEVAFYIKAGARFETEEKAGLAHLLEHMVFKASPSFKTETEVSEFLEGLGASYDASTDHELISFYVRAEKSHFEKILSVLKELIFESFLPEEEMKKEKKVILEEIKVYNDMPDSKCMENLLALLFKGHGLGRDIAGNEQSVSAITRTDLEKFRKSMFLPWNLVVSVSGNFDEEHVLASLEGTLVSVFKSAGKAQSIEKVASLLGGPFVSVETRKTEQAYVALGLRGVERLNSNREALRLLGMVLGGGMSSRLFKKVRTELSLCYYINAYAINFLDTGGFFVSSGVNLDKYELALIEIFKVLNEVKKMGVTEEELGLAKEHLKGLLAISLEDHGRLNRFYGSSLLLDDKVKTYESAVEAINQVTTTDVFNLLTCHFTNETLCVSVVGEVEKKRICEICKLV